MAYQCSCSRLNTQQIFNPICYIITIMMSRNETGKETTDVARGYDGWSGFPVAGTARGSLLARHFRRHPLRGSGHFRHRIRTDVEPRGFGRFRTRLRPSLGHTLRLNSTQSKIDRLAPGHQLQPSIKNLACKFVSDKPLILIEATLAFKAKTLNISQIPFPSNVASANQWFHWKPNPVR